MKSTPQSFRFSALISAACLAASLAGAALTTNTWTGAAGNLYWSTPGNWTGNGVDVTNVVVFTNLAVTGTLGPAGVADNVVGASQTIQALYFQNTNTPTGSGHTTYISTNVTLAITGSNAPVVIIGTGGDAGKDATNWTTIFGPGSLLVSNTSADFIVRQTSATDGAHRATLDLSGLDTLTAYVSRVWVAATTGSAGNTRAAGTLMLAKTNLIFCSTGTSAQGLHIGEAQSNNGQGTQFLYLGQTNAIFSDAGLTVARQKATAWLGFNTNLPLVNPSVLFRNRAGNGRQSFWLIGEHATSGTSTGNRGTADFSYGTVDALVDVMYVGRGQTGAGAAGRGTLSFVSGTIDVNTLEIGYQRIDGSAGQGTVNVDNTAQLLVNNNLRLGNTLGSLAPSTGTLNVGQVVPGGSVWVKGNVLEGNGFNDAISVTGGSLKVGGLLGDATAPLQTMTLNNAAITFDLGAAANPTAPLWQVNNIQTFAPVKVAVEGSALSVGQVPLLKYVQNYISGDGYAAFQLDSLPSRVSGYLSNNAANSTIDLVITYVAAPKWNGGLNGDWDINTTANWVPVTGGAATTYLEPAVPGDPVLFDDTAAGTTTVNLTTTLSPSGITFNNTSKNYTLTGSGRLSGPAALNKNGAGSLTFANTSTNDFAGAVTINSGLVRLAGSADRLPTNAAVTLANTASAALDLNGQNQTLGSLTGGGDAGGNVSLGTGTLTLQADGGVFNGVITGGGMVVKSGSGTQVFNAANSYGGGTLINGGKLVVANPADSGVGPGPVVVQTNGSLQIGDGGADGSIAVNVITNNGSVALNRNDDLTWTKLLVGVGGFNKSGPNTVTVTNANTYSGQTTISAGALRVSDSVALGSGLISIGSDETARLELVNGLTLTQRLTVAQKPAAAGEAPAIINVSETNTLTGAMSWAGGGSYWTVRSDSGKLILTGSFTPTVTGARTLRLLGEGEGEWWGSIGNLPDNSEVTVLTKSGGGTWTLWGTNTYTGKTTVNGGTLVVNGALLGSTNVTINSGGVLSGAGLITGPVIVNSLLAPGAPLGRLTISNSLTLTDTTIMEVSHGAYDQVVGLSSVTLGGTLRVVLAGPLVGGEAFRLFESASYSGDFIFYDLPPLDSPLSWDASTVPVDGTLRVVGTTVPLIGTCSLAGDRNLQFSGLGPTNAPYRVLATTNLAQPLTNWVQVGSGAFAAGVFNFKDNGATNYSKRFYRVVMPPLP